jgi:predicted RNase H-like HicB family nuclease
VASGRGRSESLRQGLVLDQPLCDGIRLLTRYPRRLAQWLLLADKKKPPGVFPLKAILGKVDAMATYYPIVVEQTSDDDFWAYVPDLPGCIAAGENYDELHRNAHEAIELYIGYLEEHGLPVPAPYSAQMLQQSAA